MYTQGMKSEGGLRDGKMPNQVEESGERGGCEVNVVNTQNILERDSL